MGEGRTRVLCAPILTREIDEKSHMQLLFCSFRAVCSHATLIKLLLDSIASALGLRGYDTFSILYCQTRKEEICMHVTLYVFLLFLLPLPCLSLPDVSQPHTPFVAAHHGLEPLFGSPLTAHFHHIAILFPAPATPSTVHDPA